MPRPNPPRRIKSEVALAQRVRDERIERNWTFEATADRMIGVGCPIQASAIFKIEKQDRRITVEELVAFARIFELGVEDLLSPDDLVTDRTARRAVEQAEEATDRAYRFVRFLDDFYREMLRKTKGSPQTAKTMRAYWMPHDRASGAPLIELSDFPVSREVSTAMVRLSKAVLAARLEDAG